MNRILALATLFGLLGLCSGAWAQEGAPAWGLEMEESSLVGYGEPVWHEKDYGWLLTFRLTTSAERMLRPVSHLRFEGKDADGEVVWTGSKTVRRKDFDGSIQGGKALFVRMAFRDVPGSVASMELRFDNGATEGAEAVAE